MIITEEEEDFNSVDKSFIFQNKLVPKPVHQDYLSYFNHCNYMDKPLAYHINIKIVDKEVTWDNIKETKSILDNYCMLIRGFDMS